MAERKIMARDGMEVSTSGMAARSGARVGAFTPVLDPGTRNGDNDGDRIENSMVVLARAKATRDAARMALSSLNFSIAECNEEEDEDDGHNGIDMAETVITPPPLQ